MRWGEGGGGGAFPPNPRNSCQFWGNHHMIPILRLHPLRWGGAFPPNPSISCQFWGNDRIIPILTGCTRGSWLEKSHNIPIFWSQVCYLGPLLAENHFTVNLKTSYTDSPLCGFSTLFIVMPTGGAAFWVLVLTKSHGVILYRMPPYGHHFGNILGFETGSTVELC